ncbi:MAG: hypothetical protein ACM3WQ_04750 [Chloroflexota bacterium]
MIKKYFTATLLLIVFLAAFLPLASSNPDGLTTVTSSLGIQSKSIWQGLMNGYSIPTLENDYMSTLLAGTLGIIFVFVATLILGTMITKRSQTKN